MIALIVAVSILVCVVVALHCCYAEAHEDSLRWKDAFELEQRICVDIDREKKAEVEKLQKDLRIRTEERDIAYDTIIKVRKQVAQ